MLILALASAIVTPAMAQDKKPATTTTTHEKTTVRTTEKTMAKESYDLLGPPLLNMNDTTTVPPHRIDLRMTGAWETANYPANGHDKHDDTHIVPHVVVGLTDNLEMSVANFIWVDSKGDVGPLRDGNYDTHVGALWRFRDQEGYVPAMAVSGGLRVPTGQHSNGVDAEVRALFTNQYDNGMRSHINVFGTSVNGNNDGSTRYLDTNGNFPDDRHFQYGIVVGMDGPLCDDGKVHWIADYMNRSGQHYGSRNMNILELGFQWQIADNDALSMATQIGLDGNDQTPNAAAGITYSHSLCW